MTLLFFYHNRKVLILKTFLSNFILIFLILYNITYMEKKELNLENPIFVFYFNAENMSRSHAEQFAYEYRESVFNYRNATFWILAADRTEIECIWPIVTSSDALIALINEINEKIEMLSGCTSCEDFKIQLRDWKLNKIIK